MKYSFLPSHISRANFVRVSTYLAVQICRATSAFAFKNVSTGEVIVAYRGTDSIKDASASVAILVGKWDSQFQKGMDFAKAVRDSDQIFPDGPDTSKFLVTGHSLGGAIAQIVAKAYGLDGSTIDLGAAARIVQTPEFRAAAVAAGLPPEGLGASGAFTNYLVAGSLVSGGTGDHIGQTSYLPSLTFGGQQTLTSFLIGLVNPVAGSAYAIGTDQFGNKHSSLQVSQALMLLSGDQTNTTTAGSLTFSPKIIGYSNDPVTGANIPRYSQTEFEIKDSSGVLQSTVKFSGTGSDRMIEVFEPGGALKSTTTLAASGTGTVTITPVTGSTVVVTPLPDLAPTDADEVTVTTKDASGNLQSTTLQQTFDDASRLETTTTPDGKVVQKSFDTDSQLTGTITDTPDGLGGTDRTVSTVVNGKEVQITQHASAAALAVDQNNDGDFIDAGDFDTTDIDIDGQDALHSDLIEHALDNNYQSAQEIIAAAGTGHLSQLVTAADASDADGFAPVQGYSDQAGQETAWYSTADAKDFGSSLQEVQSLIAALKLGAPLPIDGAVFNLAARLSKSEELGEIAGGLNTLVSLNGLIKALERGDEFGALASGLAL